MLDLLLFRNGGRRISLDASGQRPLMTMQNNQRRPPGLLESVMGNGTLVVVAIIAVVFVSMVLHLL